MIHNFNKRAPRITSKTVLGFNDLQCEHKNVLFPDHPESPGRIEQIRKCLRESGLYDQCEVINEFVSVDNTDLCYSHEKTYIKDLDSTESQTQSEINEFCSNFDSVFMTPESMKCAREGVEVVRDLTSRICHNKATNGFAVVRPPGHHADRSNASGFCLLNNVAQAAEEAFLCGAERILIVDLDVHHGQGTQRIFYDEKRVLYFSIHRYEFGQYWPHLRESDYDHIGEAAGIGYNANVPLNETGCGDADYLSILWNVLMPLASEFDPQFVIVSAGFDCLDGDPLGGMKLTPDGYSHIIHHLKGLAQGRMLMVLEGGYNHSMSAVAAHRCLRVLLGMAPFKLSAVGEPKESVAKTILSLISVLHSHWSCFSYHPPPNLLKSTSRQNPIYNYDPETRRPDTANTNQSVLKNRSWRDGIDSYSNSFDTILSINDLRNDLHDDDEHQPEKASRTTAIIDKIMESDTINMINILKCNRRANLDELMMVHEQNMIENLERTQTMNEEELKEVEENLDSIYLTRNSYDVAIQTVGTLLETIDCIYSCSEQRNAFVCTRPPGHHASSSTPSGFCLFNNVAIGVKYAQRKYKAKRVLIFDWDVHHGNGTQDIFYQDDSVLFISIHRHENGSFYPIGELKDYFDVGEGRGEGYSVNIPLSGSTMGNCEYLGALHKIVMQIAYEFNPDLVFISAGFDAAVGDPLGEYLVTPELFAVMAYHLSAIASGRIIGVLEGGYNLSTISKCSQAVCEALHHRNVIRATIAEREHYATRKQKMQFGCIKALRNVSRIQSKYWKMLKPFNVDPKISEIELSGECEEMSGQSSSQNLQVSSFDDVGALHAVVPLTTCPHLDQVQPVPGNGIDASSICSSCGIGAEVWICLTCYSANCGRFINEHAVTHHISTSHPMSLSLADLSVWCYPCESYVHNEKLIAAKSAAHESKFGEKLPQ